MPAKSVKQQRLFGAANACAKGTGPCTGKAGEIAKRTSRDTIREFAATKTKGLPRTVKK